MVNDVKKFLLKTQKQARLEAQQELDQAKNHLKSVIPSHHQLS